MGDSRCTHIHTFSHPAELQLKLLVLHFIMNSVDTGSGEGLIDTHTPIT